MIITLVKKQTGAEFIREMEDTYKSISELEKLFKRTNNMKMYVDLENWQYYKENPHEMIEITESLVTNKLSLSDMDLIILNTIKHEKPRSIRDLAKKINKDVSNIQPKVKRLEEEGFIKFEEGIKNSKIPYLTFDEIKLEIWICNLEHLQLIKWYNLDYQVDPTSHLNSGVWLERCSNLYFSWNWFWSAHAWFIMINAFVSANQEIFSFFT